MKYGDRVVGGSDTLLGEYPWQAALLLGGDVGDDDIHADKHFCGGTLISSRHVLTAAHCTRALTVQQAASLHVGLGLTNFSNYARGYQALVIAVKQIVDNPNYRGSKNYYKDDISVLVLTEDVDLFKNPHIKPVCLPSSTRSIDKYANKSAIVSGWGLTDAVQGIFPQHLQDVMVTVMGGERRCGALSDIVGVTQICAGHGEGGKDACQGDSGGPLVTRDDDNNGGYTLIGVVSAGSSCAQVDYPGIYTNVQYYMESGWLSSFTDQDGVNLCLPPPDDSIKTTPTPTTSKTNEKIVNTTPLSSSSSSSDAVLVIGGTGFSFGTKVKFFFLII